MVHECKVPDIRTLTNNKTMINWHPKNLIDSLWPFVTLQAIIGHGVFNDTSGRSRYRFSVVYATMFSIVYLTAYCYAVKIAWYSNWIAAEETVVVYAASVNVIIWTVSGIFSWSHRTEQLTCIKRLSIIDESLRELGEPSDYKSFFRCGVLFMIICVLGILITTATDGITLVGKTSIGEILFLALIFHYPTHVNTIFIINYSMGIRAVWTRLAKMNRVLDRISKMPMMQNANCNFLQLPWRRSTRLSNAIASASLTRYSHEVDAPSIPYNPKYLVQVVRQMHLELYNIAKEIERISSVQTALELTANFVTLSSLLYNIYTTMTNPLQIDKHIRLTGMCCWFTIYFGKLMFINLSCGKISTEDRRAGQIIYGLRVLNVDQEFDQEIAQYSFQLIINPLNICPGGLFTLGYSFITKFFTTMITYLVIVIEISKVRS